MIGIVLCAAFAGCVDAKDLAVPSPTITSNGETGEIRGTVLDGQLAPIVGAVVALDQLATTTLTGEAGNFSFQAVAPGDHKLIAQAIGYTSIARSVTVMAGEVVDVQLQLDALAIIEPYMELLIHDGYSICGIAAIVQVGQFPNDCPLGDPKTNIQFDLAESWVYLVTEVTWESQDSFWLSIQVTGHGCIVPGDPCPGVEIGRSPLRIDGAPADPNIAERYAIDGKTMFVPGPVNYTSSALYAGLLREELNATAGGPCAIFWEQFGVPARLGCPLGVGYSTGIRFREYLSVFHHERPEVPSEYSAIPDA